MFRAAAADDKFWADEVSTKAVLFAARFRSQAQLVDPGHGALTSASSSSLASATPWQRPTRQPQRPGPYNGKGKGKDGKGKGKGGKSKDKGSDKGQLGNRTRDSRGIEVCFKWNRDPEGCTKPCAAWRAHVCEWCLGGHRGVACTRRS